MDGMIGLALGLASRKKAETVVRSRCYSPGSASFQSRSSEADSPAVHCTRRGSFAASSHRTIVATSAAFIAVQPEVVAPGPFQICRKMHEPPA